MSVSRASLKIDNKLPEFTSHKKPPYDSDTVPCCCFPSISVFKNLKKIGKKAQSYFSNKRSLSSGHGFSRLEGQTEEKSNLFSNTPQRRESWRSIDSTTSTLVASDSEEAFTDHGDFNHTQTLKQREKKGRSSAKEFRLAENQSAHVEFDPHFKHIARNDPLLTYMRNYSYDELSHTALKKKDRTGIELSVRASQRDIVNHRIHQAIKTKQLDLLGCNPEAIEALPLTIVSSLEEKGVESVLISSKKKGFGTLDISLDLFGYHLKTAYFYRST